LLNIIVVGYGLAGRVHAKTHRNLTGSCRLAGIVERSMQYHSVIEKQNPGVEVYESLEQALDEIKGNIVLDLCVPAPQNIDLIKTAVAYGVQQMMLEKPLAWSLPLSMTVADLLRGCDAVYLDTYQFSFGVEQLLAWIIREQAEIDNIHIRFTKNRVKESFKGRGFENDTPPDAWHIEGPHMVTIAMKLAGDILAIDEASLQDMVYNGTVLANHGSGKAVVRHANDVRTTLFTDLCSDENVRLVEVNLKNQVCLRLQLPASKSTRLVSRIDKIDRGNLVDSIIIEDHPMEQCVSNSLDYFITRNIHARSIDHGVRVNHILHELTETSVRQAFSDMPDR